MTIGETEHRLSLFTDDVVFLTNLGTSINALSLFLKEFGQFSSYKVNNSKSALLLLNREESLLMPQKDLLT